MKCQFCLEDREIMIFSALQPHLNGISIYQKNKKENF
jgi:hypothetical protein